MHPGVAPTAWGLHQGGSGGVTRQCRGCPRCELSPLDLAVPRGVSEVRQVLLWVGWRAPRRGGVGIVCHGNSGVVLVPRVGVGQERGRGVAVMVTGAITRVGPLVPVGTAAPYRWATQGYTGEAGICQGGAGRSADGAWPPQAPFTAPTSTPPQAPLTAPTSTPPQAPLTAPTSTPPQAPLTAPTSTPPQAPLTAATSTPPQAPITAATSTPPQAPQTAPTSTPPQAPQTALTSTPPQAPLTALTSTPPQAPLTAPGDLAPV